MTQPFNYGIAGHLQASAARFPDRLVVVEAGRRLTYAEFAGEAWRCKTALLNLGLPRFARVATFLNKSIESATVIYAATAAGLIVVPINPKLKPLQVQHILRDCSASVLVTTAHWLREFEAAFDMGEHIQCILTSATTPSEAAQPPALLWSEWMAAADEKAQYSFVESDPAAILYTSGSTGMPKGVVLSQGNLSASAQSVNAYFRTTEEDVFLALLPFSFDAGLSQLTTAVAKGACLALLNYMRAQEVVAMCRRLKVTIIVGVPPLWAQLAAVPWGDAGESLRLFANTGGHMHTKLLGLLREVFPRAEPFLMYGLTEAFRSSYLHPSQIDIRPESVGKAIPNVELLLLREDGTPCAPGEEGELVHRGPLVSMGYWNDPVRTAERFRTFHNPLAEGLLPEKAVWSGDIFKKDAEGYLYFVGRRDDMIKSSGYRISPTEIESALQAAPGVKEVAVYSIPDEMLGQVPMAAIVAYEPPLKVRDVLEYCNRVLPGYMVPRFREVSELPRSPNGKIDRVLLKSAQRDATTGVLS